MFHFLSKLLFRAQNEKQDKKIHQISI